MAPKVGLSFSKFKKASTRSKKKLIEAFAERSGMVYFGYVSQRSDEHHIVRGLTVSTKHTDEHYCIGTSNGYDVIFVERSDQLQTKQRHVWHIMEFDLKTTQELPHILLSPIGHSQSFHHLSTVKYPSLQVVPIYTTGIYSTNFVQQWQVNMVPAYGHMLSHVLPPKTADIINEHFQNLMIEIHEQSLFLYSERNTLSSELLDTMLQNGLWLANEIDTKNLSQT